MLDSTARDWTVRWAGAQRDVLGGDVSGKVPLAPLGAEPHLYALGPLEGVRGEVTIFDGRPLVSRVVDGSIAVEETFSARACFLVYACVDRWIEVPNTAIRAMDALDAVVPRAAALHGLDAARPFPFRLTGRAERLRIHVLDKRDGLPHTPERHEEAKVSFAYRDEPVEVIGFFSTAHRGIFTPRDANAHMHAQLRNGRVAGHVDEIVMHDSASLWLPRPSGRKEEHP